MGDEMEEASAPLFEYESHYRNLRSKFWPSMENYHRIIKMIQDIEADPQTQLRYPRKFQLYLPFLCDKILLQPSSNQV